LKRDTKIPRHRSTLHIDVSKNQFDLRKVEAFTRIRTCLPCNRWHNDIGNSYVERMSALHLDGADLIGVEDAVILILRKVDEASLRGGMASSLAGTANVVVSPRYRLSLRFVAR
jgi:hypothetical protein